MNRSQNSHIVLKYKDPRINGSLIDTIQEHKQVLNQFGYVDFGVLGKGISSDRALVLIEQIKNGVNTNLYLVSSTTTGLKTFLCKFQWISNQCAQDARYPSYYEHLGPFTSWIRITSMRDSDRATLNSLITISTRRTAHDSLSRGMASTLFVTER